jgi:hypothetical protein
MYPDKRSREYASVHRAETDNGVPVVVSTIALFTLTIAMLGYSPWPAIALVALVFATVLLSRNTDHFGLGICVLLTISLSYYFSMAQIPGLVTIIRVAIIGVLGIGFVKSGREPNEYRTALVLLALFFATSAASSYYYSLYVSISELKLLFGGLFFFGLILSTKQTDGFPSVLFGVLSAIIAISLLLFVFYPAIGYAYVVDTNAAISAMGRYAGVLNHPQLLACLVAVNLPLIVHTYLTKTGILSSLALLVIICAGLLIAISSSRTGLLAGLASGAVLTAVLRRSEGLGEAATLVAVLPDSGERRFMLSGLVA